MEQALEQARQAAAQGEFPVGCVIADERAVLASGGRRSSKGDHPNELDHAEIMALRRFCERRTTTDAANLTIYSTMEPCLMCFGAILLNRIPRIVYAYEDVMGGGTGCRLSGMPELYASSGIRVVAGVRRKQSLALFKAFFADSGQSYWKDSLLAEYTLSQD